MALGADRRQANMWNNADPSDWRIYGGWGWGGGGGWGGWGGGGWGVGGGGVGGVGVGGGGWGVGVGVGVGVGGGGVIEYGRLTLILTEKCWLFSDWTLSN